jgi:hypothetical protein
MKLEMHGKWALLVNDDNTPVVNKNWYECYGLAKALSTQYGKKIEMIPVREAERLCSKDCRFKKLLTKYWIHNAEIMKACNNSEELRKKLKLKTKNVCQWSDEDGVSSVGSRWLSDGGCFYAYAYWPSRRADRGVAAFLVRSIKGGRKDAKLTGKYNSINVKI